MNLKEAVEIVFNKLAMSKGVEEVPFTILYLALKQEFPALMQGVTEAQLETICNEEE